MKNRTHLTPHQLNNGVWSKENRRQYRPLILGFIAAVILVALLVFLMSLVIAPPGPGAEY